MFEGTYDNSSGNNIGNTYNAPTFINCYISITSVSGGVGESHCVKKNDTNSTVTV